MRLIDADGLMELYADSKDFSIAMCNVPIPIVRQNILDMPTIEAEPVKHGSWIEDGYYGNPFVCSYCGHEGCYSGDFRNKQYYYTNYCPNCGAKMDLVD